jgi:HSP20 family protein
MPAKYSHSIKHNNLHNDEPRERICRINQSGFSEIFISSSKLVSIYNEKFFSPPTDIFETDKEFIIRSEIAGMKPEEITISFDGNRLIITGSRDERDNRMKRTFRQMEIDYGKFEKVIEVYCGINPEKSNASYKDGFLEIIITKIKKSVQEKDMKIVKNIEITLE